MKIRRLSKVKRPAAAKLHGFTLIEVITVVAIMGILTAIAIPAYNYEIQQNIRRDAVKSLMMASAALEQCKGDYGDYTNNGNSCLVTLAQQNPVKYGYALSNSAATSVPSYGGHFTISEAITNTNGEIGYKLTATNNIAGSITSTDAAYDYVMQCKTLTLDNLGREGSTGNATNPRACWGN